MKRLRVAIIGQGRSGRNIHAHSLTAIPALRSRYKIVAVADPLLDRCQRAEAEYGCESTQDYHDFFARTDLDLIINATPSHLHAPVTKEILKAGHNVLVEKPLARYAKEVDDLIKVAKKSGKMFAIYQQSRFAPYFAQVNKVIDSGVLGRIVMIKVAFNGYGRRWDWQTLQEMNGGSLLNTGPHPVDQALGLFGRDTMPQVWCKMDRVNTWGDAEDFVKLILTGPDRPLVEVEICSSDAYPLYTYHIHGSQGGLTGNTSSLKWRYFKPSEAPKQQLIREPLPGPSYCSEKLKWYEKTWTAPTGNLFDSMSACLYKDVYGALTQGKPLVVTPEQVRQQIAVMEECHRQNPLSRLDG